MNLYKIPLICCCLFLLLPLKLLSQKKKQTVGLVLSGGGAKGLAHIGVIKALEKHNIPIDYISGSSMGAIIGGFYAAGYTVNELDSIVRQPEFQTWIYGKLPPEELYRFGQPNIEADIINFYIKLKSGLVPKLKNNLIDDALLNFALTEHLYKASQLADYNFDSLSIPFRCMASDIFTRTPVVLRNGNLSDALRASMAVPMAFRPIKINNKYLYDGGVLDNLPTKVMKEDFNPDIIIAVNLGANDMIDNYPYEKDEELVEGNVLKYLVMSSKAPENMEEKDILIELPVDDFSPAGFELFDTLINIGETHTLKQIDEIKQKVSVRDTTLRKSSLTEIYTPEKEEFDKISFENSLNQRQQTYIRSILMPYKQTPLSLEQLKERYYMLVSNNFFQDVQTNINYNDSSSSYTFNVNIAPEEKILLGIGGNVATRSIGQLYLEVEGNTLTRELYNIYLNLYSGAFYTSTALKFRGLFPHTSPFFLQLEYIFNRWNYAQAREFFKEEDQNLFVDRRDNSLGIRWGKFYDKRTLFTLLFSRVFNSDKYEQTISLQADSLNIPIVSGGQTKLRAWVSEAKYEYTLLNRKQFPSEGLAYSLAAQYVFGYEETFSLNLNQTFEQVRKDWWMIKGQYEQYFNRDPWTLGLSAEAVYSNIPAFTSSIGTGLNLPSFRPLIDSYSRLINQLNSQKYIALGITGIYNFSAKLDIRAMYYPIVRRGFINPPENLNEGDLIFEFNTKEWAYNQVFSVAPIYHSPVGPISLSLNYYDSPNLGWQVLLNAGFLLYNPKLLGN